MIRALMVDVDGVLVCGRPRDGLPWAADLKADLGIDPAQLHSEFFLPHWTEVVLGRVGMEVRLAVALRKIAPHLHPDEFIKYWFENDARINVALLDELERKRRAGMRVYLATNQEHLRARYLLDTLGLGPHFDDVFYSAAIGSRKPDPAFFQHIARSSRHAPAELLLIDDTAANVAAAETAGWRAVHWSGDCSLASILERFDDDGSFARR
ncbi:HAD-IA family hydrolase [Rhizobium sp. KVB221]|uniref:HAD-IA family hydrolase n=1 Tax=Rhizobium setariae TaxID=2801340 RepID=A0A936YN11_9HYPH|nr:HAD-IA family hydrolase [Rhizobium setariae]MBL0371717.1 HAD-IA family hydrolase [Rhizobium setariae]